MGPGLQQGKAPPRGCQGWRAQHPEALRERASHNRHQEPPVPGCETPFPFFEIKSSTFRKGGCLAATEEISFLCCFLGQTAEATPREQEEEAAS